MIWYLTSLSRLVDEGSRDEEDDRESIHFAKNDLLLAF
jgi:hypothetical protein